MISNDVFSQKLRQRGFTLIEVLISILILSVGLLGAAAMQLQSLKFTQASQWRSQANFLAYDIVERIRANRVNAASYGLTLDDGPPSGGLDTVAKIDISDWLGQLSSTIPGGDGSITWDNGSNELVIVVVSSDQAKVRSVVDGDVAADSTFTYSTRLEP